MEHRPSIGLVHTGGTLEAIGVSRLDDAWYSEAKQRVDEGVLLETVPEISELADIETVPREDFPFRAQTTEQWLELHAIVQSLIGRETHRGIVVTHGTSALEETAYFLDLTTRWRRPIVLVGAMRPSSSIGPDGYINLLRAVKVAIAPDADDQGVLVVMNETIFSARDATKGSTTLVNAFHGRDAGPLGYADSDGAVVFYHRRAERSARAPHFDVTGLQDLPRVDVVVSHIGADGALIDAAVEVGARGIVSAGMGAGRPVETEAAAVDRALAAGVLFCQSTRVTAGRVSRTPGMRQRGVIAAGNLPPWKARILLALALTQTDDPERIQEFFDLCA